MSATSQFAQAKLNLFLAITGRRGDGYHDLVSLVTPLDFGDTLRLEPSERTSLECNDPEVPVDESNLVLRAARAFSSATGWRGAVRFRLEKRIPMGAGLGGGSSDGVAALRALNTLAGNPLDADRLAATAASLGSDCPLFLHGRPIVMRGRGERVEPVSESVARRLRGRRVLVFKPAFSVSTAWAYARMATEPSSYLPGEQAEARLDAWLKNENARPAELLFNNMERVAFAKFVALPALLDALRTRFGLAAGMSGSGSACFAFLPEETPVVPIVAAICEAWGESAFVQETRLL